MTFDDPRDQPSIPGEPEPPTPVSVRQRDRFRQVVIWVAAGSAGIVAVLIVALVVMGGRSGGAELASSTTPSAFVPANESATPTATATTAPTLTPEPAATPSPAAATPEPELRAALVRGWARVMSELKLREEPGIGSAALARLLNDEVVWVTAGPQQNDGYNWYEVETLTQKQGWIATGPASHPYATALTEEETLIWCGPVETDGGARIGGLRPGPLDDVEVGAFELADAIEEPVEEYEACVTFTLYNDRPIRNLSLPVEACGIPMWDGSRMLLKPASWGDAIPEYKVKRTVEVASAILTEGSFVDPEGMTNKLKVLILGGQLVEPFACVNVRTGESGVHERRILETYVGGRCLTMTELTNSSVSLDPATGGSGVSLTRTSTEAFEDITIGQPTLMNVFASTSRTGERLWMGGFGSC